MDYKEKLDKLRPHSNRVSNYNVIKPWGTERWLDINEHYCFKQINIRAGNMTSLQSHEYKIETNYVVSGKVRFILDKEIFELGPGEGCRVNPGQIHRVVALEDSVILETSTPHVDDVIRHEDTTGRPSGKIENEHQ